MSKFGKQTKYYGSGFVSSSEESPLSLANCLTAWIKNRIETTAIIELDRLTEVTCLGKFERRSLRSLTDDANAMTLRAEAPCRPNIFKSFFKDIKPIKNMMPPKNSGVNKEGFLSVAKTRKVNPSITKIKA